MKKEPGKQRAVCLVYGQTGSGKSVLARAVSQKMARAKRAPLIIVDTLDEYTDFPAIDLESLKAWICQNRGADYRACRVLCEEEEHLEEAFNGIIQAYDTCPGPVVVLVDEVSYWTKPAYVAPGLRQAIRYGRHYEINLVCVSRRPAETARELSGQATELRIFKCIEGRDLQYFSGSLPAEVVSKLPALGEHESLTYTFSGAYIIQPPVKIVQQG